MRYDLTDFEWSVMEPLLPMDRRGPKPQNNRQVLNGIFWVLRAGAPWRDLPERYGPYTAAYNRFNRWRKAGIWDRLMDAIVKAHDGKVQMIDSSTVRVHQHASGVKKEWSSLCGPKPRRAHHEDPRPGRCERAPGPAPDLARQRSRHRLRRHASRWLRERRRRHCRQGLRRLVRSCIRDQGAIPNIPNRSNRKKKFRWNKAIYRERNHVERFFKQFRRIATRYDKLGATFFAFIQLAAIRISLRSIESTA